MLIIFGVENKTFFSFLCIFYSRKFLSPDTNRRLPWLIKINVLYIDSVPDDFAHILNHNCVIDKDYQKSVSQPVVNLILIYLMEMRPINCCVNVVNAELFLHII